MDYIYEPSNVIVSLIFSEILAVLFLIGFALGKESLAYYSEVKGQSDLDLWLWGAVHARCPVVCK